MPPTLFSMFPSEKPLHPSASPTATPGSAPGTPELFAARCTFRPDGRLARKEEREGPRRAVFEYDFDEAGRLTAVRRDGEFVERHVYNASGQRTAEFQPRRNLIREFSYDAGGRLVRAGDVAYAWTPRGALALREIGCFRTLYRYGDDTRLDELLLPDGRRVRYEYGRGLMPERVLCGDRPALEYAWEDVLRLTACRDLRSGNEWRFDYADGRVPVAALLRGPACRAYGVAGLRLGVHVDQVGSVRLLTLPDGRVFKRLEYDSFGNILDEAPGEPHFPLGFAGGLHDPYSGLTRFGFRDYAPEQGRFTAKDPLGDTGGNHDLYEYCADDPVTMNDPSGLKGEPAERGQYSWFRPW